MGAEQVPSRETANEKNSQQPWAALEQMSTPDTKTRELLVNNLIKNLKQTPAPVILTGLVKTLEKTGIRTDWETLANQDQIRNFISAMPKSFIIFLQETLQKSGYDLGFRQGKRIISGTKACDGHWGDASQNALLNFFHHYNEKKNQPIRKQNLQVKIASDHEKLLQLTKNWPTSSLPEGFQKNGAISDKGKTTLLLLAQGNNDINGLIECQFAAQEENRAAILAAIKTIFGLIKDKKTYQATHFSHGKITINGQTISLWGKNPELLGLIGKENDKTHLVSDAEKEGFLKSEAKHLIGQYNPLCRKMYALVRQIGLPIDEQEKLADYLQYHIHHAKSMIVHHPGYKEGIPFPAVAFDEKGNRYDAKKNLNDFKRVSDQELERLRKKLDDKGYLAPQLGVLIEEIKKQKEINYLRSKQPKGKDIEVSESYYRKVKEKEES